MPFRSKECQQRAATIHEMMEELTILGQIMRWAGGSRWSTAITSAARTCRHRIKCELRRLSADISLYPA